MTDAMIPKLISPAEFRALVDAAEGRDRLIIKLLAGTGHRISGTARSCIPAPLVPELRRWVESFDHFDHVFSGQGINRPMAASRIRQIVHEGAMRAGIQRAHGRGKI